MTDMIGWLRGPKPWHKYTPAEVADAMEAKDAEIERLHEQVKHAFESGFHAGWRAPDQGWIAYDAAEQHYWKDYCGVKE